jgi:hypothetical protein
MKKDVFEAFYQRNGISDKFQEAYELINLLEKEFIDLDNIDTKKLDLVIEHLVNKKINILSNFLILMRYYIVINRHDLYIHLTRYTGFLDVIENILARLKIKVELNLYHLIIEGYQLPFMGVSPNKLPSYIADLMHRLKKHLEEDLINDVLTGNNHGLSERSQIPEKLAYEASDSLENYLKERHQRKVKELEEHWKKNKVWFEQTITEEVVNYVKNNQEILSAKLVNDKLYITKIPYDTVAYLNADKLIDKHYYGCHCPFVREAIKTESHNIPKQFCYCSAGFEKFPFEIILGEKLSIKCLETILGGSSVCRFEIDLSNVNYKTTGGKE